MPFRNRIVYVFALRKERVKEASQKKKRKRKGERKDEGGLCMLHPAWLVLACRCVTCDVSSLML